MTDSLFRRICFFLTGVLLLPFVCGTVWSSLRHLSYSGSGSTEGWLFVAGMLVYAVLQTVFFKPITMHVYGHEITHVVWAWLFGGKVKKFTVQKGGGEVVLTKSNFLVRLAPYFFPLYAVLLLLLYGLIYLITGHHGWFRVFAVLLGIAVGFHIGMTLYSLKVRQSDLSGPGYFFSIPFILIMNTVIMMLFISLFFSSISFIHFLRDSGILSLRVIRNVLGVF